MSYKNISKLVFLYTFFLFGTNFVFADYVVNFEGVGETDGGYAAATVNLSGLNWSSGPEGLVGTNVGDIKNGARAARIRNNGGTFGSFTMLQDKVDGLGTISLQYARANFSGDRTGISPVFVVEYSMNGGVDWLPAGSPIDTAGIDTLTTFSTNINQVGSGRIRIRQTAGDSLKRFNVDDIAITDFVDTTKPVVTFITPTKASNTAITNTTVQINDNVGINVADVAISATNTTGGFTLSNINCTQTNTTTVDCTLQINGIEGAGDIQVSATDTSLNNELVTETGFIIDTTAPVITRIGSASVILPLGEVYTDAGATASDNRDGDITVNIVTFDPVDNLTLGTYILTYNVSDAVGNAATQVTRSVEVRNTEDPIITFNAPTKISNNSITDIEVVITDNIEISVLDINVNYINTTGSFSASENCVQTDTATVTCAITINNQEGTGDIQVEAQDTSGNSDTNTEIGFVIDTTAPTLTLNGLASVTLTQGDIYTDAGASANDSREGNLTGSIVTTSNVNSIAPGTYSVRYNVSDTAGNAATELVRTVVIEKKKEKVGSRRISQDELNKIFGKKDELKVPSLGENKICPASNILTQNLKAPARNGKYHAYTRAIVKEAKILQAHMNRLGFNAGPEDGIIGPLTDTAIKRMQTFLGTTPDGYVGPKTRELLNKSCS